MKRARLLLPVLVTAALLGGPVVSAPSAVSGPVTRLSASDPIGLAVAVSRASVAKHSAGDLLLADVDRLPFAYAAGAATGAFGGPAPLLFTHANGLDGLTSAEIDRALAPPEFSEPTVYLLGPSLDGAVRSALRAKGFATETLAGPTPADTAVAVARRLFPGAGPHRTVLLASPNDWAGAAAAGAWGASQVLPVLLGGAGSSALPAATRAYLADAKPTDAVIVGDRATISLGQERALEGMGLHVRRASGPTPVTLAAQVAATWANSATYQGAALSPVLVSADGPATAGLSAALLSRQAAFQKRVRAPVLLVRKVVAPTPRQACADTDGRGPACYLLGSGPGALTVVGDRSLLSDATVGVFDRARSQPRDTTLPRFKHIFVVVLENEDYDAVFGPGGRANAPYLNTLVDRGTQATDYFGVDHLSLTNYIAMTSGQRPNDKTRADCFSYDCVYPEGVRHIGDQLEGAGKTWKAYLDGMKTPCQRPPVEGQGDPYIVQNSPPGNTYATRHNPFMYYANVVRHPARCNAHDVPYPQLGKDLASGTVPAYSLVVPDLCHDGHDETCIDGSQGGIKGADQWLSREIPKILNSAAYKDNGALFITFDEAEVTDSSGCCGNSKGGHIGMVVLSPLAREAGYESPTPANHYSLLRTTEAAFGLPPLGGAADPRSLVMNDLFSRQAASR